MTLDLQAITGQVHFDSHVTTTVEVAAALVNALATAEAGGRPVVSPTGREEVRARAQGALQDAGARRAEIDADEAAGLQRLAVRLREVFAALDDGREDDAAGILNVLLAQSGARPHLHRHPPAPWHLHFHLPEAGPAQGWTAGCATGLAHVLGSEHAARLGTCAAPACERVFVDVSRNGSRRFCSTACQNRVKAAAHRARGSR
ncbi:MAG: CGNR zinc finger domain-containing protein [Pseudonocardiaceae bacterium]